MRCSSPAVPGTAHGRASVSGSREYGWNRRSLAVAFGTEMSGRLSSDGTCHGSAPLATNASDRYTTGVMYLRAMRAASIASVKHSPGVAGATTGIGDSPLRPKSTWSRSDCSTLVGMPVDGPARWTSITTSGSSTITARPIASDFSVDAGPGRAGHRQRAAVRRPDRGADRRDLVLGLERPDAELLVAGQLVEDVRRRRDRIGPVEQVPLGELRRRQEPEPGRLVAGDVPVQPGRERARAAPGRCVWNISVVSPYA